MPPSHWYSAKIVVSRHFAKKFQVNKKSRMAFASRFQTLRRDASKDLVLRFQRVSSMDSRDLLLFFFFFFLQRRKIDDDARVPFEIPSFGFLGEEKLIA